MQAMSGLRWMQRWHSGSPHSFFCRQKWQQMPAAWQIVIMAHGSPALCAVLQCNVPRGTQIHKNWHACVAVIDGAAALAVAAVVAHKLRPALRVGAAVRGILLLQHEPPCGQLPVMSLPGT